MKSKTINISEDTHNKLREYCNKEGIIIQHYADKIIREWLESIQKKQQEVEP